MRIPVFLKDAVTWWRHRLLMACPRIMRKSHRRVSSFVGYPVNATPSAAKSRRTPPRVVEAGTVIDVEAGVVARMATAPEVLIEIVSPAPIVKTEGLAFVPPPANIQA